MHWIVSYHKYQHCKFQERDKEIKETSTFKLCELKSFNDLNDQSALSFWGSQFPRLKWDPFVYNIWKPEVRFEFQTRCESVARSENLCFADEVNFFFRLFICTGTLTVALWRIVLLSVPLRGSTGRSPDQLGDILAVQEQLLPKPSALVAIQPLSVPHFCHHEPKPAYSQVAWHVKLWAV